MDTALTNMYTSIEAVAECLRHVGEKTKLPRSISRDHLRARKIEEFTIGIVIARDNLFIAFGELVKFNKSQQFMPEIAHYMMKLLVNIRLRYDIEDELCLVVIKCIVRKLIGDIMDNKELNSHANYRQELSKLLLYHMIIVRPKIEFENSPASGNSHEGHQNMDTSEEFQDREDQEQSMSQASETDIPKLYTWEAKQILDFLFDAITRHSISASKKDADMMFLIYNVMNITHIVDIIDQFLEQVKQAIFVKEEKRDSVVLIEKKLLKEYHKIIESNLEMFQLETPFVIFKSDLLNTLCKLKMIITYMD